MATAFPLPAPGSAPSVGPMKVFEIGQKSVKRRGHDGDVLGPKDTALLLFFFLDQPEKRLLWHATVPYRNLTYPRMRSMSVR
jgi:hypothetical protein